MKTNEIEILALGFAAKRGYSCMSTQKDEAYEDGFVTCYETLFLRGNSPEVFERSQGGYQAVISLIKRWKCWDHTPELFEDFEKGWNDATEHLMNKSYMKTEQQLVQFTHEHINDINELLKEGWRCVDMTSAGTRYTIWCHALLEREATETDIQE